MNLVFTLLVMCHMSWELDAQQCRSEYSIRGMMLKGHTFMAKRTKDWLRCVDKCNHDVTCQSFNYVISQSICELNNRTKEARPQDFVPDSDRFYIKRLDGRAPLGSIPELPAESCAEIGASEGEDVVSGNYWLDSIHGEVVLARCHMSKLASTCKELYDNSLGRENKSYILKVGSVKIPVYCHMTGVGLGACGGGGWTLVMKTDGTKNTFHFNSTLWSNRKEFNLPGGKTGLDSHETKLLTYWNTPFSKICLGMKFGHQTKFTVINKHANSLYSLIADGHYRATSLGRNTWKTLIGSQASLQYNCNKEGFNAVCGSSASRARIGYVGNNENDCSTCDSRIGFGAGGYPDDTNTCGNAAGSGGLDNGSKNIKAMGYILVQ